MRTLAVDAAEAEQLMLVVDKYHQVSVQSSARVCFACDMPSSMTVVEFFGCFECRSTRNQPTVCAVGHPVPCAFLMPSLSELKKKKLGLYFILDCAECILIRLHRHNIPLQFNKF